MTIDFSSGNGTMFFYRAKPAGDRPAFKLKGKYSNKYLVMSTNAPIDTIEFDSTDSGTGWFSATWTTAYNRFLDVAGYYNLEYYTDSTLRFTQLVKVVNNAIAEEETVYTTTAAKEANEQTVYFR